jgi:hypothetical protein
MSKKKSDNKLLILAGLAAVGYYMYTKGYFGSAATPAVSTGLNVIPTAVNTSAVPGAVSQTTLPQQAVTNSDQPAMTPVTSADSRITEIMQWVNTLTGTEYTAAVAAIPLMTQDEIAGLYDIVKNDFYGNGITTAAQRTFWNAWRTKYNYA